MEVIRPMKCFLCNKFQYGGYWIDAKRIPPDRTIDIIIVAYDTMYIVKWNEAGYLGPNFYVNDGEIRRIEEDIDWWMPAPPLPLKSDASISS